MKYIYFLFSALLLLSACSDIERGPVDRDGVAPQQVTDVSVNPIPGGAKITYVLPDDPDLLYIEAVYTLPNGETNKINSSYNGRSISVEGFAEVKEYQVFLTSVDRSGNRSEPYAVKFIPQTPPVITIFNTIRMQADFGGVNVTWDNPSTVELAVIISKKDVVGDDAIIDTYYTSSAVGTYTVRGLDIEEGEFSVKLRDKWNNYSEVKREKLTPLYETMFDRGNYKNMGVEYADNVSDSGNTPNLWNKDYDNNVFGGSKYPWYISYSINPTPVRLSRIVIWQYGWPQYSYGHYYSGGNGKTFEIYGSNNPTSDMSGWTLLMTCDIVKKSGLPYAFGRDNMSDEDFDIAHNKGHEFIFPLDAPAVKYLRVRSIMGFGDALATCSEIELYGDPRTN